MQQLWSCLGAGSNNAPATICLDKLLPLEPLCVPPGVFKDDNETIELQMDCAASAFAAISVPTLSSSPILPPVSYPTRLASIHRFTAIVRSARGEFGYVYKARWHGTQVAAKVLLSKDEQILRPDVRKAFNSKQLGHPNVMPFYHAFVWQMKEGTHPTFIGSQIHPRMVKQAEVGPDFFLHDCPPNHSTLGDDYADSPFKNGQRKRQADYFLELINQIRPDAPAAASTVLSSMLGTGTLGISLQAKMRDLALQTCSVSSEEFRFSSKPEQASTLWTHGPLCIDAYLLNHGSRPNSSHSLANPAMTTMEINSNSDSDSNSSSSSLTNAVGSNWALGCPTRPPLQNSDPLPRLVAKDILGDACLASDFRLPPLSAEHHADSYDLDDSCDFSCPSKRETSENELMPIASLRDLMQTLDINCGDYVTLIVMEHCDYGPLSKALEEGFFSAASKSEAYFSMRACIRTAKEIACGLDFLHSLDIVHGNLKLSNVLLQSSSEDRRGFVARISDFGYAKQASCDTSSSIDDLFDMHTLFCPPSLLPPLEDTKKTRSTLTSEAGARSYLPASQDRAAAELHQGKGVDVQAFGLVLRAMLRSAGSDGTYGVDCVWEQWGSQVGQAQKRLNGLVQLCTHEDASKCPTATVLAQALGRWDRAFSVREARG
eukprot:gene5953-33529_t